jgi:hypothetical protein
MQYNRIEEKSETNRPTRETFVTFHKKTSLDTYYWFYVTALVPLYYITALVFLYEKNDRGKNLFLPTAAMY